MSKRIMVLFILSMTVMVNTPSESMAGRFGIIKRSRAIRCPEIRNTKSVTAAVLYKHQTEDWEYMVICDEAKADAGETCDDLKAESVATAPAPYPGFEKKSEGCYEAKNCGAWSCNLPTFQIMASSSAATKYYHANASGKCKKMEHGPVVRATDPGLAVRVALHYLYEKDGSCDGSIGKAPQNPADPIPWKNVKVNIDVKFN